MNAESWRAIKELFAEARDLEPASREALLRARAATEPELVASVRGLLRSAGGSEGFLEPPDANQLERPVRRLTADFRGTLLGEFELLEEIGRGASGVVYLGRQPSLGRDVAIKILGPQFSTSEDRRARFEREALGASRVRHPNVVSVLSYGEQSGICYLVLEHVAGRSLHAYLEDLRRDPRDEGVAWLADPREAARIVAGIARGLAACHRANVVHRDVKPQNILLDRDLEPRIVDFGLAKHLDLASLSDAGSLSGTPHYMSPEQAGARGHEVDHRSDVYSAGAVLYELLTLSPPATGASIPDVLRQVQRGRPPHLRLVAPDVPSALATVCMRALGRDPADRYPTAADLADDLERYRTGRAIAPGIRWLVRDRLSTMSREHPWVIAAGSAVLLLGLQPTAGVHVDASPRDSAVPTSAVDGPTITPKSRLSVANDRIDDLLEMLSDEPIYHDEDG